MDSPDNHSHWWSQFYLTISPAPHYTCFLACLIHQETGSQVPMYQDGPLIDHDTIKSMFDEGVAKGLWSNDIYGIGKWTQPPST